MPAGLLGSQLETLEALQDGELGAVVAVDDGPEAVVERALRIIRH